MARSKLLHEFINGAELENTFLKLKTIFYELENKEITNWIDSELEGYKGSTEIPSYRIAFGTAIGDYTLKKVDDNLQVHYLSYTNEEIPLPLMAQVYYPDTYKIYVKNGVSSLLNMLNNKSATISYQFDFEACEELSAWELEIEKMKIVINEREIQDVVGGIKSRLLKVILELEANFDNLDSLDIFNNNLPAETKEEFAHNIINIVYQNFNTDSSITIGNNNKIKDSEIGHRSGKNVD